MDLKLLTELSQDDFDKKYENVYKDIKLTSQVKDGNGNDGFCYPESGCVTPIINPYVMTPMQAATTRFLLGEFMQSDEWKRIDETLKYNAPVRYDDIVKVRDKYFDEQYFMDVAKNYPDKSSEAIRNLAIKEVSVFCKSTDWTFLYPCFFCLSITGNPFHGIFS